MIHSSHAALVEEVADQVALARMSPKPVTCEDIARAILSLIFARLSDVTPEMAEAAAEAICALHEDLARTPWSERADSVRDRYRTEARAAISAFLAASPLAARMDSP